MELTGKTTRPKDHAHISIKDMFLPVDSILCLIGYATADSLSSVMPRVCDIEHATENHSGARSLLDVSEITSNFIRSAITPLDKPTNRSLTDKLSNSHS